MESWEVLEQAIPRAHSDRIGKFIAVSGSWVRKWRRQPESDDAPTASGQRSILDRICELIDAVFLINPSGSGLIVNHINGHYRSLVQIHAKPISGAEGKAETISELLTQTTEAINHFNLFGCTPETVAELVQARHAFEKAIECVESTMKSDSPEEETNA